MYKFAVLPEQIENWNGLSQLSRARMLNILNLSVSSGLSIVLPLYIEWFAEGYKITVFTHTDRDQIKEGAIITGHTENDLPETFFIDSIHKIRNGRSEATNEPAFLIKPSGTEKKSYGDYLYWDQEWVNRQMQDPFIEKALKHQVKAECVWPSSNFFKANFFKTITDIEQRFQNKNALDTPSCFPLPDFGENLEYSVIGRNSPKETIDDNMAKHLKMLEDAPGYLSIVNFIDKTDTFSHAQTDFCHAMAAELASLFPKMKIFVLDAIVKDDNGETRFYDIFSELRRQSPYYDHKNTHDNTPFAMVIGGQANGAAGIYNSMCYKGHHRVFDFDLFKDCRASQPTNAEREELYTRNLDNSIHTLMRVAGSFNHHCAHMIYDLRGYSKAAIYKQLAYAHESSVVIRVIGEKGGTAEKKAKQAATLAIAFGYPYITTLIHDRFDQNAPAESITINIPDSIECYTFEMPENTEETILDITGAICDVYQEIPLLKKLGVEPFDPELINRTEFPMIKAVT